MASKKTTEATKLRKEIISLYKQLEDQRQLVRTFHSDPKIRKCQDDAKALQQTNASSNMKLLLLHIDKWTALYETGTEEYQTGLIMKSCAQRFRTSFANGPAESIKVLREAFDGIEPFAETPKGFFPYINIATLLYENDQLSYESDQLIKKAYNLFVRYTKNMKEPIWHYTNIFSGEEPTWTLSNQCKNYIYDHLCYNLHFCYIKERNLVEAVKIAVPGIRYLQNSTSSAWKYAKLGGMVDVARSFFVTFHFKQLDHCLAGLMFHLVKYRQSLPESSRKEVSKTQAEVGKLFTMWGATILNFSVLNKMSRIDIPIKNDLYEELEWFKEPGVEVYAHQFPIELVEATEELKRIAKRVNKWDKKTAELFKDGGSNEWVAGTNDVVAMMNNNLINL